MFVDLSVILNEKTPVYPGDALPKFEQAGKIEQDLMEDHVISFNNHLGTHIDAPSHMVKGGKTLDKFSIDTFVGNGVLIKIDKLFKIDQVRRAQIKKGDIVLFHTGMTFGDAEFFTKYPPLTEEVANYLVEKNVKMVGVDSGGVDYHPFPIHKIFLENDILIIEDLTNLELLLGKRFTVYAFPLKLQLDGSPTRVVAKIEQ